MRPKLSDGAKLALLLPAGVAPVESKVSVSAKLALRLPNGEPVNASELSARGVSPGVNGLPLRLPLRLRKEVGSKTSPLPTLLIEALDEAE